MGVRAVTPGAVSACGLAVCALEGQPQRADGESALHTLDVLTGIERPQGKAATSG